MKEVTKRSSSAFNQCLSESYRFDETFAPNSAAMLVPLWEKRYAWCRSFQKRRSLVLAGVTVGQYLGSQMHRLLFTRLPKDLPGLWYIKH